MEKKDDSRASLPGIEPQSILGRLRVLLFALLFLLPSINSIANEQKTTGSNPKSVSSIVSDKFKSQLSAWRESQSELVGLEIKLDRRFKAQKCSGPYSFHLIKNTRGLISAECHSPKWSRVLKTSSHKPSTQSRQTDQVWVAAAEIAAGQLLTNKDFKEISIESRKMPRNALKSPPSGSYKAKRRINTGEIILANTIYEPKYGFVAKTTIPSGSFLRPDLIARELIREDFPGKILENARGIEFMAASRTILAGNPIRSQDIRKAKLVRRGDQVKLVSAGTSFTVSSKTIALEDGYLDEQIRLLAEDGKREIRAKISGISSAIALN